MTQLTITITFHFKILTRQNLSMYECTGLLTVLYENLSVQQK